MLGGKHKIRATLGSIIRHFFIDYLLTWHDVEGREDEAFAGGHEFHYEGEDQGLP